MKRKHILTLFLAVAISAPLTYTQVNKASATNFAGKENYYYKLCASKKLSKSKQKTCKEFNKYLKSKNESLKDDIASAKKDIASTQGDIDTILSKIEKLNKKISSNESRISYVNTSINNTEKEITTKKETLKERLYAMQSEINSHSHVDYLLGASSFTDFFSRAATLRDITAYENQLVKEIQAKQDELKVQQTTLKTAQKALVTQQQAAKAVKKSLYSKITESKGDLSDSQSALKKNTDNIEMIAANMKALAAASDATRVSGVKKVSAPAPVKKQEVKTTTKNEDGSTTTTETKSNGNGTATKTETTTKTDGTTTTKTETVKDTTPAAEETTSTGSSVGVAIANKALSKQGVMYLWGASGPNRFDCSGLVYWAHNAAGVKLGRTTAAGYSRAGKAVSRSAMQPGDVITFSNGSKVHHIGIYIGNNMMVHAPSTGKPVQVANLSGSYWQREWHNVRRLY